MKPMKWEFWLEFAGLIVFIGVAIEAFDSLKAKEKEHAGFRSKLGNYLVLAAPWLVAIGVLGEWLYGVSGLAERNVEHQVLAGIRESHAPRHFKDINVWGKFSDDLKSIGRGTVQIWYQPEDVDAYSFALDFFMAFHTAGWKVQSPIPIPNAPVTSNMRRNFTYGKDWPLLIKVGAQPSGITILAKPLSKISEGTSAYKLVSAFRSAKIHFTLTDTEPDLPFDYIVIVGPKSDVH